MIVLDIETSGMSISRSGVWQIAALDLISKDEFIDEARLDENDEITDEALEITGKTEEELRDENKQSQKELIQKFFYWLRNKKEKNFICQNPQFDIAWVSFRCEKYGIKKEYPYRAFDLHTIAQLKHSQIHGSFLLKEIKGEIKSDMNLPNILKFCGIPDERMYIRDGKVIQEGKPHDALEDCKLEGECFSRLVYGRNLFQEFKKFPVPNYLKQNDDGVNKK